ncbi:hypothetical protein CC78DRAFT_92859 [Lojkania enalia]|uniref:Uncharacterized protein n=1 Tax=Lojkania enalia TaxID=147567 RepID=A0A9P4KIH0_9PLEO|nr:hypothetical protein CC78DRAFT_92859 [Didymosphaeria enalia]
MPQRQNRSSNAHERAATGQLNASYNSIFFLHILCLIYPLSTVKASCLWGCSFNVRVSYFSSSFLSFTPLLVRFLISDWPRRDMAQSQWPWPADPGTWSVPPMVGSHEQISVAGATPPNPHADNARPPRNDSNPFCDAAVPQHQIPLHEQLSSQDNGSDQRLTQQIISLLPFADSTAKHSILLQLLDGAAPNNGNASSQSIGRAHAYGSTAANIAYDVDTGFGLEGPAEDIPMISPLERIPSRFQHEQVEKEVVHTMDLLQSSSNPSSRETFPSRNVSHSDLYYQVASLRHYSDLPQIPPSLLPSYAPYGNQLQQPTGPNPIAPPLNQRHMVPFGGGQVMSSQASNSREKCSYQGCESTFGGKSERKRHERSDCKRNPDPINYTCLLHMCTSECSYPCDNKLHVGPIQVMRDDKIVPHLKKHHGWHEITLQQVPKSWLWPVMWSRPGPGWTCKLCSQHLGTWPEDQDTIDRHVAICKNGNSARASRYPTMPSYIGPEETLSKLTKRLSMEDKKPMVGADEDEGQEMQQTDAEDDFGTDDRNPHLW